MIKRFIKLALKGSHRLVLLITEPYTQEQERK